MPTASPKRSALSKRITALFGGFDIHLKVFLSLLLSYVFTERLRTEGDLVFRVLTRIGRADYAALEIVFVAYVGIKSEVIVQIHKSPH